MRVKNVNILKNIKLKYLHFIKTTFFDLQKLNFSFLPKSGPILKISFILGD